MCPSFQSHYNQHKDKEDLQREGTRLLYLLTWRRHCPQHAILEVQKVILTVYLVCSSPLCPHHIQVLPQLSPDLCSFLKSLLCRGKYNYVLLPFPKPSMHSGSKDNLSPKSETDSIPQFASPSLVGLLSCHSSLTPCVAGRAS